MPPYFIVINYFFYSKDCKMNIGIYYGSTTGATEEVAEIIQQHLNGHEVTMKAIADTDANDLTSHDLLILGTSTWGAGDLQEDWEAFIPAMDNIDLSGKKTAIFGLGDQSGWADTFVDGMKILYDHLINIKADVIGSWEPDAYDYLESQAIVNGKFLGLALDQSNQADKTEERIAIWLKMITE
jgi:flavodoxin I